MTKPRPAVNGILAAVLSASFPTSQVAFTKDAKTRAPFVKAKPESPGARKLAMGTRATTK